MKNLQEIMELTRDEVEQFRNDTLAELQIESSELPFSVFAALRAVSESKVISNGMFCILLHYVTNQAVYRCGSTNGWLDDDLIKGWILLTHDSDRYIFFLTEDQINVLVRIKNAMPPDAYVNNAERITHIEEIASSLEGTPLTEEEENHPLVIPFLIPVNSASLNVAEHTSRFSGASWFEEIQKKTIILAGLGGIGSWTCLLLSRVQPTSLFIYDDDIVEAGNMSGQLYGLSDVGHYKADAIANIVNNYANYNSVFAIKERFTEDCEATDIMICGFDNMTARKIFYTKWLKHVQTKRYKERKHCLFIDGRLSAEYLQIYCIVGDDYAAMSAYSHNALFSDAEADETVCSYKQTSYMANMIGSLIVNLFTNFVTNEVAKAPVRELPYFTSYDGNSMQLKIK